VSITIAPRVDCRGSPSVDGFAGRSYRKKRLFWARECLGLWGSESLVRRRCRSGDPEGNMEILLIRLTAVRLETDNDRVVDGG
jgi:hypothetical protein